nr:MAG TPA_asm: InsA C-terminal domain [Caudoviricetes sp.]
MTKNKNSESLDSSRQWRQLSLFDLPKTPRASPGTTHSGGQRSSRPQSEKSSSSIRATSEHRMTVTVNDNGRAIGEDHVNARYLNADVEHARQLRAQGYTYRQISQMLDMPIRTLRDYLSGRRRCQSVAGWKTFLRRW